jgi:hypothetical protein
MLTARLKRPAGSMRLLPVQALALAEMIACQGAAVPIKVGCGKTLTGFLSGTVLGAQRPLLVVPAKHRDKTRRAWRKLAEHWQIPACLTIVSYETISQINGQAFLERGLFDLIACDEAQKLKSKSAGVTKKIGRYLSQHPECRFVPMSGTFMKWSVRDFAHLFEWSLRAGSPVPREFLDLVSWAGALDTEGNPPGILAELCEGGETVREAFRRRLVETPGVVATLETPLDMPIVISKADTPEMPADVADALAEMRRTWCTPDGQPFVEAVELWRHAREMALGWYQRWDPPAPRPWLEARKEYSAFARQALARSHRYDTELAIVRAIESGALPDGREPLARWRAIKASFVPNPVPVFLSDYIIDWASVRTERKEIIWTQRVAFAERLAQKSGLAYYGREGRDRRTGRSIIDAPADRSCIASMFTVREGFDLERFSENLILEVFTCGDEAEQLLARTHRRGQTADEVSVEIAVLCDEHERALASVLESARAQQQLFGGTHKVIDADWTFDP